MRSCILEGDERGVRTTFLGHELQSPIIVGSSPASFGADAMIRCHEAGAGAVVCKTINRRAAENPDLHMVLAGKETLINCEKWTDFPMERWLAAEMPQAVAAGVTCIASVGHGVEDSRLCVERLEDIGVMAIELVSYTDDTVLPMLEDTKRRVDIPVIVKLSPNSADLMGHAQRCVDAGADALTVCDSIGPAMRIDIETGKPLMGSADGCGWLTGAAIFPLTVARIAALRQALPNVPIIGLGGITSWQDGIEFVMAGADMMGVASAAILHGPGFITRMNARVDAWCAEHGVRELGEMRGRVLEHLSVEQGGGYGMGFDYAACRHCNQCVTACAYRARSFDEGGYAVVDGALCRHCGLCASVCGFGAITVERGAVR